MKPSTITLLSRNRQNRVAFALARAPREFNPISTPLAKNPSQFEAAAMAISVFWCCISARPGRLGEGRCDEFTKSDSRRVARDGARFRAGFSKSGGSLRSRTSETRKWFDRLSRDFVGAGACHDHDASGLENA